MSLDRPDPPKPPHLRRRPFDEVLAEFAERTGRPLWKVQRCRSSNTQGIRHEAAA